MNLQYLRRRVLLDLTVSRTHKSKENSAGGRNI